MTCFIDIETEINEDAIQFVPEPEAPANYKDPQKIEAYKAEKRAKILEKAPLDFDLGKITAIAVRLGIEGKTVGWLANERRSEADLLRAAWSCIYTRGGLVCGYNIIGFDLPFMVRRSFALGVEPLVIPTLRRYSNLPEIDLMQILAGWDRDKWVSLKFFCSRYGIVNHLPDLDGAQVASMDDATKLAYVKNEVDLIVKLYQNMNGYYFRY